MKNITDKQAEQLSKLKELNFGGLENLTDKQAMELAKVEHLFLNEDILTLSQKVILKK